MFVCVTGPSGPNKHTPNKRLEDLGSQVTPSVYSFLTMTRVVNTYADNPITVSQSKTEIRGNKFKRQDT